MKAKTKRRSVSVAPAPFARLHAQAAALGCSCSSLVEGWIAKHCAPLDVSVRIVAANRPRKKGTL